MKKKACMRYGLIIAAVFLPMCFMGYYYESGKKKQDDSYYHYNVTKNITIPSRSPPYFEGDSDETFNGTDRRSSTTTVPSTWLPGAGDGNLESNSTVDVENRVVPENTSDCGYFHHMYKNFDMKNVTYNKNNSLTALLNAMLPLTKRDRQYACYINHNISDQFYSDDYKQNGHEGFLSFRVQPIDLIGLTKATLNLELGYGSQDVSYELYSVLNTDGDKLKYVNITSQYQPTPDQYSIVHFDITEYLKNNQMELFPTVKNFTDQITAYRKTLKYKDYPDDNEEELDSKRKAEQEKPQPIFFTVRCPFHSANSMGSVCNNGKAIIDTIFHLPSLFISYK